MEEATANLIDLADAAGRVLSLLHRFTDDWHHVPNDICELRDDIDRLSSLLENVRHAIIAGEPAFRKRPSDTVAALIQDVATARRCLDAVRLLVTSFAGQSSRLKALSPLWKSAWARRRQEIAQVRARLRESNQDILSRLLMLNVTVSADIYASVRERERNLSCFQTQLAGHIDARLNALSSSVQALGAESAQSSTSLVVRDMQNEARFKRLETVLSAASKPSLPQSNIEQRTSRRCRCVCHSRWTTKYELSTFANSLGSFSLGYVVSHPSAGGRPCKLNCCPVQHQPSRNFKVTYTFPSWLLYTAVTAVFTDLPSPELLLRVHRRIPKRFDIFHASLLGYAAFNQVDEARRCLSQRLGSVTDILDESDSGPLDVALRKRFLDMAILLVREGADVFQETSSFGASCVYFVQDMYANPRLPEWPRFEVLLPMDRILDYMDLSVLHEAVLKIRHTNIRDLLEQEICPVDACDVAGRTALSYATVRGDTDAVEALLAAGAQPRISHANQTVMASPLGEACRQGFVDIAFLLMSAGADVNETHIGGNGGGGWTALHRLAATSRKGTVQIAAELLRRGADVHAVDDNDLCQPLHQACYNDTWELVDFLVGAGADLNARDREGTTPLECAVAFSAARATKALFAHGVDYTNLDEFGNNVLHHLAHYSDVATMQVFLDQGRLVGLDITRENVNGKTPLQLFKSRPHATVELCTTFESLLEVASRQGLPEPGTSLVDDEDDDVFFDAPANLTVTSRDAVGSKEDAFPLDPVSSDGTSLPILDCLAGLNQMHDDEAPGEDPYIDTNKYRLPEHTNSNGTKVSRKMRMEHLGRKTATFYSPPPRVEAVCPTASPRHQCGEEDKM